MKINKLMVVGDDDPLPDDEENILICCIKGTHSPYTDNVEALCALCGVEIFHRPTAPKGIKPVCMPCGFKHVEEAEAKGEEITHVITQTTAKEVGEALSAGFKAGKATKH